MKSNCFFISLSFIVFAVFYSCTNKVDNKKERLYNGIDSQILNIVDSIPVSDDKPFATVWFDRCNDSDNVVRIYNTVLIPIPPESPAPFKMTTISGAENFRGYKKYDSIYIVFIETNPNGNFEKFVKKDSLNFDEKPFNDFNIYDYGTYGRKSKVKHIEKRYLINEKDSLVLYTGKCLFDNIE